VVKNSFAFNSFKNKSVYTTEEKERRAPSAALHPSFRTTFKNKYAGIHCPDNQ
jgi:hypothetical protein